MKQVILTKGLPASGKTTWAKKKQQEHPNMYKRINKDDLRDMLDNGRWERNNEKFVLQTRDQLIIRALEDGKHVIIDDTNLHPKHEKRIQQLVTQYNKAHDDNVQVVIEDSFLDIRYTECIKRDAQRQNPVGAKVIRNMFWNFVFPPDPYQPKLDAPDVILCDIDGTLALMGDRSPYDASNAHEVDRINPPVRDVVETYNDLGYLIIFLSGRSDEYKKETEQFIKKHVKSTTGEPIQYNLYMRKKDDARADYIVKKELFDTHVRDYYNVKFILDDRNQVVDLWRKCIQIPCFQTNYGDF